MMFSERVRGLRMDGWMECLLKIMSIASPVSRKTRGHFETHRPDQRKNQELFTILLYFI